MRWLTILPFVMGTAIAAAACGSTETGGQGGGGGKVAAGGTGGTTDSNGTGGTSSSGGGTTVATGGGGGALCSGTPECPTAGCTFAAIVMKCTADDPDLYGFSYTTKPCGGYDKVTEVCCDDYFKDYYFDHATGKLVATYEMGQNGDCSDCVCTGPSDFVFPDCEDWSWQTCDSGQGAGGAGGQGGSGAGGS